jgi:hypothetical protein
MLQLVTGAVDIKDLTELLTAIAATATLGWGVYKFNQQSAQKTW